MLLVSLSGVFCPSCFYRKQIQVWENSPSNNFSFVPTCFLSFWQDTKERSKMIRNLGFGLAKGLLTLSRFTIYWYSFVCYKDVLGDKAEMFLIFSWIHIQTEWQTDNCLEYFYIIIAIDILTLTKMINEYFIALMDSQTMAIEPLS